MTGTTLVMGATGTVGTFLVRKLDSAGVAVKAAVRTVEKGKYFGDLKNVEITPFDMNVNETIAAAFYGVRNLFLLTSLSENQLEMEKFLVACAKAAGVKYIVKLSASGADTESGILFERSNRESEKLIEESGIPFTFLRPNSFMQDFVTFHGGSIKKEGKIYLPQGLGKVSYVDARDVANCAASVFSQSGHEGKTYHLTGPDALTVAQVAEIFTKVLGKKVEYADEKEPAAKKRMEGIGMPDWMVSTMLELYAVDKAGKSEETSGDVERLTGQKPTSFEQFAKDYAGVFA